MQNGTMGANNPNNTGICYCSSYLVVAPSALEELFWLLCFGKIMMVVLPYYLAIGYLLMFWGLKHA